MLNNINAEVGEIVMKRRILAVLVRTGRAQIRLVVIVFAAILFGNASAVIAADLNHEPYVETSGTAVRGVLLARNLEKKGQLVEAAQTLLKQRLQFPDRSDDDEVLFLLVRINQKLRKQTESVAFHNLLFARHPDSSYVTRSKWLLGGATTGTVLWKQWDNEKCAATEYDLALKESKSTNTGLPKNQFEPSP